jgi:tRNA G37 N-methylase Trm5
VGTKGKVVTLEPFDETFNMLCENIKENGFEKIINPSEYEKRNFKTNCILECMTRKFKKN